MKHIEYDYQCAVFQWVEFNKVKYPELKFMYAVINETRGISPQKGARDKRQGKRSGVPDICLPAARGGYFGLYIEMKAPKGQLTDNQIRYAIFLKDQGYCVACCKSPESATKTIKDYMALGPFKYKGPDKRKETPESSGKSQCFSVRKK